MNKKSKQRLFKILLFLCVLGSLSINYYVKYTSNRKCYKQESNLPACAVGIIFGAGVKHGIPGKYLRDRLDAGIDLYKHHKIQKLLLSGDNGSDEYDEITAMKNYCRDHGADTTMIFVDYAGFDTYSTLYRAKHIFKVNEAILITQNYHLDRAVYIGNRLGINAYGFSANKGSYPGHTRNSIREYFAIIKSTVDLMIHRKPKYLGEQVDINGPSNYTK